MKHRPGDERPVEPGNGNVVPPPRPPVDVGVQPSHLANRRRDADLVTHDHRRTPVDVQVAHAMPLPWMVAASHIPVRAPARNRGESAAMDTARVLCGIVVVPHTIEDVLIRWCEQELGLSDGKW
jgi:hypothetical protein